MLFQEALVGGFHIGQNFFLKLVQVLVALAAADQIPLTDRTLVQIGVSGQPARWFSRAPHNSAL
jgi:hypothetical protein